MKQAHSAQRYHGSECAPSTHTHTHDAAQKDEEHLPREQQSRFHSFSSLNDVFQSPP